jgi:hypothetical protein
VLPHVVAGQQQVENDQISKWFAAREKRSGARAVGTGDAISSDVGTQSAIVPDLEFHAGHAGLHS